MRWTTPLLAIAAMASSCAKPPPPVEADAGPTCEPCPAGTECVAGQCEQIWKDLALPGWKAAELASDPGPLLSIWGPNDNELWIGGAKLLLHWDGRKLEDKTPADYAPFKSIRGAGTAAWALSKQAIYRLGTGGFARDATAAFTWAGAALWATPELVMAIGVGSDQGTPYPAFAQWTSTAGWTDGGLLKSFSGVKPLAIWGADSQQVYAVSEGVRVLSFDGTSWRDADQAIPGAPSRVSAIHGTSRDDVWAVGTDHGEPKAYHLVTGTPWHAYNLAIDDQGNSGTADPECVHAWPGSVWVAGSKGLAWHRVSSFWETYQVGAASDRFRGIWTSDENEIWLVGETNSGTGTAGALLVRYHPGAR